MDSLSPETTIGQVEKAEGYSALLAQEKFINDALAGESNFLPSGGSPGPVVLELPKSDPVVRLIVLDTQWWLHQYEKPEKSPETVIEELVALLDTELPVVVVGTSSIAKLWSTRRLL